ncbi:MAG: methyltransferase domain-containing protein [Bacteroidia bacterium]
MQPKYDEIGIGYNTTRRADPYLLSRMCSLLSPISEGRYLDIGCGTGNYTIALQGMGLDLTGIDPSREMLAKAREKAPAAKWLEGVAERLPFEDGSFDGVLATLTLHHWSDMAAGIAEAARVLRPGGRFVTFTSDKEQMEGYWLCHYFPRMLEASIKVMPSLINVTTAMEAAGLQPSIERYHVRPDLQDLFLASGKHDPCIYLKPEVRRGISTFAALGIPEEIEEGLAQMAKDIASGEVTKVIHRYESDRGEYAFVMGIAAPS